MLLLLLHVTMLYRSMYDRAHAGQSAVSFAQFSVSMQIQRQYWEKYWQYKYASHRKSARHNKCRWRRYFCLASHINGQQQYNKHINNRHTAAHNDTITAQALSHLHEYFIWLVSNIYNLEMVMSHFTPHQIGFCVLYICIP